MRLQDVLRCEFIGLHMHVVDAKNPSQIGLQGKIVDETKNTIKIDHGGTTKTLLKKNITITLNIHNKTMKIEGHVLVSRPEARLKKRFKL